MSPNRSPHRGLGLLLKTTLFSWIVALVTVAIFVAVILPEQRATFRENLESKARGVSAALQDVAAGAVVTEDYSALVDHCTEVLAADDSLEYIVLTRNDGFSLVHERAGWRNETLGPEWRPAAGAAVSGIGRVSLLNREVFFYAKPFEYSGIAWGWTHIGLSLEAYHRNLRNSYRRIAALAVVCGLISLGISVVHARRITRPVLHLRRVAEQVADGHLSTRAFVQSGDEVEALADSFNTMTGAVEQRDRQLREQNRILAHLVTEPELHAGDFGAAARLLTEAGGRTLRVRRASIWLFSDDQSWLINEDLCDGETGAHTLAGRIPVVGHEPYFDALRSAQVISTSRAAEDERTRCFAGQYLLPHGITAMLDAPIRLGGQIAGALCFEHCGSPREWTLEEENFAGSVANLVTLALEARSRRRYSEQLMAAKEAAEAASEAKSQFLANMSHEIRTPINGVIGMLHLLGRTTLDDKQRRYVEAAHRSAETLLTVIGDVLDFSKIEAGRLELEIEEFNLRDAVDGALRLFAGKADTQGLELNYRIAPDTPYIVRGDSVRLRQILINLVGNAVKFTSAGEVFVDCAVAELRTGDVTLTFSVRDTGPGIPADQRKTIFESFSQGDASMRRRFGGTGLGLAIARQLVQLMGGRIGVEDAPGGGALFTFTVNLGLTMHPERARPLVPMNGLRLLVLEDSSRVRDTIVDYARAWGCRVVVAGGVEEARQALAAAAAEGDPCRVGVVDGQLAGHTPAGVAAQLKADPQQAGIHLVLMSSFSQREVDNLRENGFAAQVSKPIRPSDLYDAVISAANGYLPATAPARPPAPARPAEAAPPAGSARARILLAEDNEINQQVAGELLSVLGHDCTCVVNGEAAFERVIREPFDLVLMDCQMPDMDGYEATRRIRAWEANRDAAEQRPRLPVIALTAHAMTGDRDRCLEAGMDDYLSKPLNPRQLEAILARWMPAAREERK